MQYTEKWARSAPIRLDHEAVAIDPRAGTLRFRDGSVEQFDHLISSVPLPDLVSLLPDVPADVRHAASQPRGERLCSRQPGVRRPDISSAHISYFYDAGHRRSRG